jgi:redox-sensitive bicupin YhaK (pirin superfamily)
VTGKLAHFRDCIAAGRAACLCDQTRSPGISFLVITIRSSEERGHADHGWLDTRFTFSFADYYDPKHMGFRSLRVINDDRVAAGAGFPMHPHRDMEIITYMLDGVIAHKDSMGNAAQIRAGEVQRMTAGTGILHSEFNPSPGEAAHLLQIWIHPRKRGLTPEYDQRFFAGEEKQGKLLLVASGDGRDGSMKIEQDVDLFASRLDAGERIAHDLARGRHGWVQVARGSVLVQGQVLQEGDGAAIEGESRIEIEGIHSAEFLLFDLD